MFQLIVAVIAIALVVVLVVAALWYGGFAFISSSEKAEFARYQNEGTQISGALKVYQAMTGVSPKSFYDNPSSGIVDEDYNFSSLIDLELIKDESLRNRDQLPWVIEDGAVRRLIDMAGLENDEPAQLERCVRFNKYAYKDKAPVLAAHPDSGGCPPCSDTAFGDYPTCQTDN